MTGSAVIFDAAADRLLITSSVLNYNADYAVFGVARLNSDLNAQSVIFAITDNNLASLGADIIGTDTDGTSLTIYSIVAGVSNSQVGTQLRIGQLFTWCICRRGNRLEGWLNGQLNIFRNVSIAGRGAAARLEVGAVTNVNLNRLDGAVGNLIAYPYAPSPSDIVLQMGRLERPCLPNLYGMWPTPRGTGYRALDLSPNRRNFTEVGTLTDAYIEPQPFDPTRWYPPWAWAQAVALSGVQSNQAVGAQTVAPGAVALALAGIASNQKVGVVSASMNVQIAGVPSNTKIGEQTAVPGAVTVSPAGIGPNSQLGLVQLTPGAVSAVLAGIASNAKVGSVAVTQGAITITLTGIASNSQPGSVQIVPGAVSAALAGIASDAIVGSIAVTQGAIAVYLTGIPSNANLGVVQLVPGAVSVVVAGISSSVKMGSITVTRGAITIILTGIASNSQLGAAQLVPGAVSAVLAGIASNANMGVLTLTQNALFINLSGIAPNVKSGAVQLVPGAVSVSLVSIKSNGKTGTLVIAHYVPGTGEPITFVAPYLISLYRRPVQLSLIVAPFVIPVPAPLVIDIWRDPVTYNLFIKPLIVEVD
jgi:hypothetical protein